MLMVLARGCLWDGDRWNEIQCIQKLEGRKEDIEIEKLGERESKEGIRVC